VCFKQRTITEFFTAKESVTLIHKWLKNLQGVNAVVKSTVSRASLIAVSAKGQAELVDARRSSQSTVADAIQAFLKSVNKLIQNKRQITTRKIPNELSVYKEV
jgi:hypothetical protein